MSLAAAKALAVAALRIDEGCRLRAYPDPLTGASPWTIGYGHTGLDVHPALVWTQAQAEIVLEADLDRHCTELVRALPWLEQLDPVRAAVLINMAFNLGIPGLMAFRNTLAAVRNGAYARAANGMRASLWARQVRSRAERLACEMETGERGVGA
ncbi:MAG: glycoside hydrolase family protein [Caulobacteraceae bacterium]